MIEMLRQNADKFWARVNKRDHDECWLWQAHLDRDGYGQFQFRHKHCKQIFRAHRVAYMLDKQRSITSDVFICHRCDNPGCVNPSHLKAGNNNVNMVDCVSKGRQARGSKNSNAKLTESQVSQIKTKLIAKQTKTSLAKEFSVCVSTIRRIARGDGWKHV